MSLDPLEPRQLLSFSLAVNFQPAGVTVPSGYVADTGAVYGDRGGGRTFGWNADIASATRDRNSTLSPDQRYDTLVHTQAYGERTWEVAVPSGTYQVHLVCGDAGYTDSYFKYNVENTLVLAGAPTAQNHWVQGTGTVTVTDGRLTLSNAAGASNNKICFLEITDTGAPGVVGPTVPGTIQAENFDDGGKNVSWYDTTAGNAGGAFRTNTDVDVQSDSDGGYSIGHTQPTEWTKYTFNVASAGTYTIDTRVASATGGTFHLEFDGVDRTGSLTLPNTGGWQTWKTVSKSGITLSAGQHTMRLVFDHNAVSGQDIGNIDYFKFTAGSTSTLPSVSITASDNSASEPGSNTGTFTVTRTGSTAASLTVKYLVGGSATNGVDYNSLSGSVVIPAGTASVKITVTPKDDSTYEGVESVALTLTGTSDYVVGTATAAVNIADNETPPITSGDWPKSFTLGETAPRTRWESTAVAMDGKIWCFGGWYAGASIATQAYDVYDVASGHWTQLGTMPIAHTHAAAAADPANHVIYFAGGLFGNYPGTPTPQVWKYNTLNNSWTQMKSMPEAHEAGCLALVNNQLHYIGGSPGDDRAANTGRHIVFDLANPAAGWTAAPDMPDPRDHFGHVVLNGKIICIGGEFGHDKYHIQQTLVDAYDPVAKTWTRLGGLPVAKSHMESSTFLTPAGKIICAGGQADNYASTDNVAEYDPAANKWTTIGKLPIPLAGPVVQMVGNKIIVTGGNTGDNNITRNTWIGLL